MKEKVVLAYSGGLDTTAIIPWLKETFNYDVICCCIDCGQGEELDGLEERAKLSGAAKLYIEDICDEFWYVYTKPEIRRQRMKETRNYSDEKVDSVMRNQQPDEAFFEQCSFVIKNNTTLSDVYAQLKEKLDQQ